MNKQQLLLIALETRALQRLKQGRLTQRELQALQLQAALLGSQAALDQLDEGDEEDTPGYATLQPIHLVADVTTSIMIVRTGLYQAYRSGSIATYKENDARGWVWVASASACKFCANMDGTVHPLSEEFESHPNCNCTTSPST